ncbi:MAG: hypothetical protein ACP5PT_06500 [Brevinematia bacterium]
MSINMDYRLLPWLSISIGVQFPIIHASIVANKSDIADAGLLETLAYKQDLSIYISKGLSLSMIYISAPESNDHLELGIGIQWASGWPLAHSIIGYRHQEKNGGLMFRAGINPVIVPVTAIIPGIYIPLLVFAPSPYFLMPGVSIGFNF